MNGGMTREEFLARGWEEIGPGMYSFPTKLTDWICTDEEIAEFVRKYAENPEEMIALLGLK